MSLNAKAVAHLLVNQGLITTNSIVNGEFQVTDVSRRNKNYRVECSDGHGFFIKQLQSGDAQAIASFRCEAAMHWLALNDPDFKVLNELSPHCHGYDANINLIVTDLINNARTLSECLLEQFHGNNEVQSTEQSNELTREQLGEHLGQQLTRAHWHCGRQMLQQNLRSPFPEQIPWILRVGDMPVAQTTAISAANRQLLSYLQTTPETAQLLHSVKAAWQVQSLIHGDLKPDNCLVVSDSGSAADTIHFIDWELADFGDPAWDLGTVLQGIWMPCLLMYGQFDTHASFLQPVRTLLNAFLNSYLSNSALDDEHRLLMPWRAVQFAAARMLQSAYEFLYNEQSMTTQSMQLIQAAVTLHANPGLVLGKLGYAHE